MKTKIHHASLLTENYQWYVDFFREVFNMTISRTRGESPHRQLWFSEGIQINELPQGSEVFPANCACDHISLGVDIDPVAAADLAIRHGCRKAEGKGDHWFVLPNGVMMELKSYPKE